MVWGVLLFVCLGFGLLIFASLGAVGCFGYLGFAVAGLWVCALILIIVLDCFANWLVGTGGFVARLVVIGFEWFRVVLVFAAFAGLRYDICLLVLVFIKDYYFGLFTGFVGSELSCWLGGFCLSLFIVVDI